MTLGRVSPLLSGPGAAGNARTVACACGQWISAIADDDGIFLAIRSHRMTSIHRAWFVACVRAGTLEATERFGRVRLPIREGR